MPNMYDDRFKNKRFDGSFPSNIKYRYPNDMKLRPDSETHRKLIAAINKRLLMSQRRMQSVYSRWERMDQILTTYVPLDDKEEKAKQNNFNAPISIVMPTSYATMEVMLTYLLKAFATVPIFRYDGVGPDDIKGAILMEEIVQKQAVHSSMILDLHTMFRSSIVYGIGPVTAVWDTEEGYVSRSREDRSMDSFLAEVIKELPGYKEKKIIYEGNRLGSIDPYTYYPDTSVAPWETNKMEFLGWIEQENRMNILAEEEANPDKLFNARFLEFVDGHSHFRYFRREDEAAISTYGDGRFVEESDNVVDRVYLYWNLVPAEWGLGRSNYPEKWIFSVVGDEVIIQAHPVGLNHNRFPVVCAAPDTDGFSPLPVSKLEVVYGFQQFANYMINSRVTDISRVLKGMFIADPYKINIYDIMDPNRRVIRTRQKIWGQGVSDAFEQVPIQDISAGHMQELQLLEHFVEKGSGSVDFLKGIISGGERKTAEEVRTTSGAALSRLEKAGTLISSQAIRPLGIILASQTQQFMQIEQYIKIAGRNEKALQDLFPDSERGFASPLDLDVNYDVIVNDGTLPNQGDPNIWTQIYQAILQNPEVSREIDSVAVFKYLARISGATHIDEFVRKQPAVNASVQSDEDVLRQVEAGNLVPTSDAARDTI